MKNKIDLLRKDKWYQVKSNVIVNIINSLYIILFLYAATSKLIEYDKSELQMLQSPLITDFAHILVWLVPTVEIIVAILLMIEKTSLLGMYASFTLMSAFTVYIICILNFSPSIPCSCGGILNSLGWTEHLVFNIIFIIMSLIAIMLKIKTFEWKGRQAL